MNKNSSILDKCDNLWGTLKDQSNIKKRIKKFLDNPAADNWDDICSVVIDSKSFTTIWNAVIEYDPTFPRVGRTTNEKGELLKDWSRIPTPFEVMKAIQRFKAKNESGR